MLVRMILPGFVLSLAGCVVVGDQETRSGFGSLPNGFDSVSVETINNAFGVVTLATGVDGTEAGAFAALQTTSLGSPLPTSDVTYTGNYEIIGIEDIDTVISLFGSNYIRGNSFSDSGTITVVADVSNGTLTGSDGTLLVFGLFSGNDLDGTVTYDNQAGQLEGSIFAEGGIAAFHGNNGDRVFAGGLTFED